MQIAGWNPSPLARSNAIRELIRAGDTRAHVYIFIYTLWLARTPAAKLSLPSALSTFRGPRLRDVDCANAHVERDVYMRLDK